MKKEGSGREGGHAYEASAEAQGSPAKSLDVHTTMSSQSRRDAMDGKSAGKLRGVELEACSRPTREGCLAGQQQMLW